MWEETVSQYLSISQQALAVTVSGAVAVIVLAAYLPSAIRKLIGKYKMKKREKKIKALRAMLGDEAIQLLEDHITDVFTNAVYAKRITDDQARTIYSRLAHTTGLWGLHPRKFCPSKTPEDLEKLKEQLKARRSARETNRQVSLDKLLGNLAAELG